MKLFQHIVLCSSHVLWAAILGQFDLAIGVVIKQRSPIVSSSGPSLAARDAAALKHWDWYASKTARAWDLDFYDNIVLAEDSPSRQERQLASEYGTWYPYNFASNDFGWHQVWGGANCSNSWGNDWSYGHIVRTVYRPGATPSPSKFLFNETSKFTSVGEQEGACKMFEDTTPQCVDQVWDHVNAIWETKSASNENDYWHPNNASYGGHTVRTIYDCLLDRLAVEYGTVVPEFGTTPVQYELDGTKYYRYYDSNDFAWFASCPSVPASRNLKRQGAGGRNSNPIWDFSVPEQKHPAADRSEYPTNLGIQLSDNIRYTAMYWPTGEDQYVTVDGQECMQMAVSRPGLRHWTARIGEILPDGYSQITDEVNYPSGWTGFTKRAYSDTDAPFTWL